MTNTIRAIAEIAIPEGNLDEFKDVAAEIIDEVEANEPNTLSYEWFLSSDERKCYVVQLYRDSEAVLAHLGNIADLSGRLHQLAPLTRLMIFGSPSDELRQAIDHVGPEVFEHWNGVTR